MFIDIEILIVLDLAKKQPGRIPNYIVLVKEYSCIELSYRQSLLCELEVDKCCFSRSIVNHQIVSRFELLSILTHVCDVFEECLRNLTTFKSADSKEVHYSNVVSRKRVPLLCRFFKVIVSITETEG